MAAAPLTADQREAEEALQREIAKYVDDPLGFVLFAFQWGKGDLEGHMPDTWQAQILEDVRLLLEQDFDANQQHAVSSGHGVGKTAGVALLILWSMSVRPMLAGVVTANTQSQLTKKTWRELAIWHKRMINAHWFEWTATRFQHVDHKVEWGIDAIPWTEHNSEAFAGLHAKYVLVIFDEASAIVDKIWEVTEGALTTPRCMWFVFGNPTKNTGRFRECFGKNKHRWSTRQIDSRTCKMTNKAKIKEWEEDHDEDSDFMRVRVRGEFPRYGTNQLVSNDDVHAARKANIGLDEYIFFPKVIGVDVARFGQDESVILVRQGRKVLWKKEYMGLNNIQLAARVSEAWRNEGSSATIFVDEVGTGSGVLDSLTTMGYPAIGINAGSRAENDKLFFNKRAEMWWRMAEWIRSGADIPDDSLLCDQLTALEYSYDPKERVKMESKDDMKERVPEIGSPDRAEALALTFGEIVSPVNMQQSFEPSPEPMDY